MNPQDLADPDSYAWSTTENVRFSDTDQVGHVNNVAHVALVEAGRIAFAHELFRRAGADPGALTFARLEIDFVDDLHYPATVRIGARVLRVGTTSFTVGVGGFDDGRCVSTSVNVLVHLGEDGRPAALPQAYRDQLEQAR